MVFFDCGGILVSIETETEIQKELDDLDLDQTDKRRKEIVVIINVSQVDDQLLVRSRS